MQSIDTTSDKALTPIPQQEKDHEEAVAEPKANAEELTEPTKAQAPETGTHSEVEKKRHSGTQTINIERAEDSKKSKQSKVPAPIADYVPALSFPKRLQKKNQERQFKRFLEVLKQIHINIPLMEALEHMPTYVKFKDVLTKERRLGEFETVCLTKECRTILTSKIPQKMKDSGSFTIPVSIGGHKIGQALCDLGASINLVPLTVYQKLGMGAVKPMTVTHEEVPIILGRPFLAKGNALVDVHKGVVTMRNKNLELEAMLQKAEDFYYEVFSIDGGKEITNSWSRTHEDLKLEEVNQKQLKPSVEEPPKLELKALPQHLKYAYLGVANTLPIIIAANLLKNKEEELLAVLKEHRRAIG
ncbi:uncharacterized protein LOC111024147 [Momordica charantia]|uniref:Uncharacterized protein LOC111024147 n=1 Tax=Momordica charantia TaxID=3673 RepID=A0A6J1DUI2_MOMCH|nr:uncharacterized protein LOC111024147 [Momordica charantia]